MEKYIVIDAISGDYTTEPIDKEQLDDYCKGGYGVSRHDIVYKLVPVFTVEDGAEDNSFKLVGL